MFERSRTQRLTIRQAKTMPAELQINDFVHSTSEMHCKFSLIVAKVNVILEQLDSLNKRMQTAKNNFDVT